MVANIYRDTDPRLHGAAGLSVLAHLEDMVARELVRTDGPPAIGGDRCFARAGARNSHVALLLMAAVAPPKEPGTGAAAFVIGTTWTLPWALRVAGRSWPAS